MTVTVPRALSPTTNPTGLLASAGVIYAAVVMIVNAVSHQGVIDPSVIIAAVAAVGALLARNYVTPVADPKNGAGTPLVPATLPVPVVPGEPAGHVTLIAPVATEPAVVIPPAEAP